MLVAIRRPVRRSSAAPLLLAAACAAFVSLVPSSAWGAAPEIVARVNGEPVTRAELARMVGNPLTSSEARQELGLESPAPSDVERLALRKVVHRRLILQEAHRRNIQITDQELDREIAALRRRFDDLRSFGAWMKDQGLDEASLFQSVREDMAAERVRAALIAGVRVSDEELRRYYDARAGLGRREVRLQIIAVGDEPAASEIEAALQAGADFGRLARRRSSGMRAALGGDTGWVRSEEFASPLREAVATMRPGDTRGPLRRGTDFLFVRLNGQRRGEARMPDAARPEIERRLLAERQRAAVVAWLTEQEMGAKIELFHEAASGAGSPDLRSPSAVSSRAERR